MEDSKAPNFLQGSYEGFYSTQGSFLKGSIEIHRESLIKHTFIH